MHLVNSKTQLFYFDGRCKRHRQSEGIALLDPGIPQPPYDAGAYAEIGG